MSYEEKVSTTAERLNQAMKLRGLKQSDLVARTGIGRSGISQYTTGSHIPKREYLDLIASVLHVSPAWLAGFDVPMSEVPIKMVHPTPSCPATGEADATMISQVRLASVRGSVTALEVHLVNKDVVIIGYYLDEDEHIHFLFPVGYPESDAKLIEKQLRICF